MLIEMAVEREEQGPSAQQEELPGVVFSHPEETRARPSHNMV